MGYKTLGPIQGPSPMKELSADTTIAIKDLNKTYILDATGEAISLAAAGTVEAGTYVEFIVSTVVAGTAWVITSAATDIHGIVMGGGLDDAAAATADTQVNKVTFATGAEPGDWVRLVSNGTFWFCRGQSAATAGVTLT